MTRHQGPPPGPATMAGGMADPLGRMMDRWGRTTTSPTNPRPSSPTGPKGQPFPQPGPAGREGRHTKISGPTGQQFVLLPVRFMERSARSA